MNLYEGNLLIKTECDYASWSYYEVTVEALNIYYCTLCFVQPVILCPTGISRW